MLLLIDVSISDGTSEKLISACFLKENWRTAKWVALGAVVFEALLFTVALIVQSGNQDDYDSDDEYIGPRSGVRQPLVNKQIATDPRVPNLDYRPIRNDAWSQRMRDKVSTGDDISRRTKKQMHNPLMLGRCSSVPVSEFTANCAITSTRM
ncbi:hypothetical protein ACQJBY_068686 [Aegilops geniculata]